MKVLVVGNGGREHAIVQALQRSSKCDQVIAAPGNGGMADSIPCFPVPVTDVAAMTSLAVEEKVGLVIIGPEVPLCLGLADSLRAQNIPAFGPGIKGARLEGSKVFTKDFLVRHQIPTAQSESFTELEKALDYLDQITYPAVIKADGLAAGKGVIIAQDKISAEQAVRLINEQRAFGDSGDSFLIEEFLEGEEVSIHAIVSDGEYFLLPSSQDHKRAGEGDTGLNTGGMGAYAPADVATPEIIAQIEREVIAPTIKGFADEGIDYRGVLYAGIMLTPHGPKVLEFNVRFGDPETQVLLPLLESDPLDLFLQTALGNLARAKPACRPGYSLSVVLASSGYPGPYESGIPIFLPNTLPNHSELCHAGTQTAPDNKGVVTAGGRVLNCTGFGPTLAEAAQHAYQLVDSIEFKGKQFRRDIGHRQLNRTTAQG